MSGVDKTPQDVVTAPYSTRDELVIEDRFWYVNW